MYEYIHVVNIELQQYDEDVRKCVFDRNVCGA